MISCTLWSNIFSIRILIIIIGNKKINSILDTKSKIIIHFMGSNKYIIITKIKCWPVFKQDPTYPSSCTLWSCSHEPFQSPDTIPPSLCPPHFPSPRQYLPHTPPLFLRCPPPPDHQPFPTYQPFPWGWNYSPSSRTLPCQVKTPYFL